MASTHSTHANTAGHRRAHAHRSPSVTAIILDAWRPSDSRHRPKHRRSGASVAAFRPESVTDRPPPISRRGTGGEHAATRQQQPTRNDSKRQGQRRDRSIAPGHGTAVLVSPRQRPWFAFGLGSQDCQRRSPTAQDHDVPIRARHRRRLRAPAIAVLGAVATGVLLVACSAANPPPAAPPATTRPAPSRAPTTTASARGAELGVFEVSCHTGKGVTASGRPSSRETVSVDPRMVPLGTRLVIDKVGPRVAADTGGAIRGRRLDIWEP